MDITKVRKPGYELLGFMQMEADSALVLMKSDVPHHPYVTWVMDEKGNTYHGHYFMNLGEAKWNFMQRIPPEIAG